MLKDQGSFDGGIVLAGRGCLRGVVNADGLVLHSNFAVGALHAIHDHRALGLVRRVPKRLLLFENEHARLVVVQDRHAGARVVADQPIFASLIVQLHEEVFIWLPVVVVKDLHNNFGLSLATLKVNDVVDRNVVIVLAGLAVLGADSDRACNLSFVKNLDSKGTSSLTHRVVEA